MDDKRGRIVEAAKKRFRYYGIKKTTMREVAQDAGVAVGTLYLSFVGKDDLVVACAEDYAARHRRHAEELLRAPAPAGARLREYLLARFRQAGETRTGSRHAAELAREVLRLKPDRLAEEGRMMGETVVSLLGQGNTSGEWHVADPEADARVLLFSIAIFFPHALNAPPTPLTEGDFLLVVDWFLGVWKQRPAKKGRR
jgi:AcrR family transcriptional regulator